MPVIYVFFFYYDAISEFHKNSKISFIVFYARLSNLILGSKNRFRQAYYFSFRKS